MVTLSSDRAEISIQIRCLPMSIDASAQPPLGQARAQLDAFVPEFSQQPGLHRHLEKTRVPLAGRVCVVLEAERQELVA